MRVLTHPQFSNPMVSWVSNPFQALTRTGPGLPLLHGCPRSLDDSSIARRMLLFFQAYLVGLAFSCCVRLIASVFASGPTACGCCRLI